MIDWSVRLTDVILLIVTFCLIPLIKRVNQALMDLHDIKRTVGHEGPPASGLFADMVNTRHEVKRQRDWLIELNARMPPDDRVRMERT